MTLRIDGIDVSHHQGEIPWDRTDRYELVIAKATQGRSFVDRQCAANLTAARARGVRYRGLYHFLDWSDPGRQAAHLLETVDDLGGLLEGEHLWLDWESDGPNHRPPPPPGFLRDALDVVNARHPGRVGWYTYRSLAKAHRGSFGEPLWLASPADPVRFARELGACLVQFDQLGAPGFRSPIDVNYIVDRVALDMLCGYPLPWLPPATAPTPTPKPGGLTDMFRIKLADDPTNTELLIGCGYYQHIADGHIAAVYDLAGVPVVDVNTAYAKHFIGSLKPEGPPPPTGNLAGAW